jgi:NAD(P)-dependent dehydrogenase (short-subunit alcohol dehydrogenase family)
MEHTATTHPGPTAVITGASRGLGRALAHGLADRGWTLIIDARDRVALARAADALAARTQVIALPGDVTDPAHRARLRTAVDARGRLDLLVNNAGALGPSPLPALVDVDEEALIAVHRTNAIAPLLLFATVRSALTAAGGTVMNITSDAATGPWPGWGVYGASKAALEQFTRVLGAEHPALAVYAVDPGDLRTDMHQAAFPDEDISDRPEPSSVVPAVLSLLDRRPASGRYRARDLAATSDRAHAAS